MEHFAASSVGDAPIPSRDLACVIGVSEDQGGCVDEDEVSLLEIGLDCHSFLWWVISLFSRVSNILAMTMVGVHMPVNMETLKKCG